MLYSLLYDLLSDKSATNRNSGLWAITVFDNRSREAEAEADDSDIATLLAGGAWNLLQCMWNDCMSKYNTRKRVMCY